IHRDRSPPWNSRTANDRGRSDDDRVLGREPAARRRSHNLHRQSGRCPDDRRRSAAVFPQRLSRDAQLMRDMRDTLRATFGRVLKLENRRRTPQRGSLDHLSGFERPVTVYLPPGYAQEEKTRYPVLYMQDGQNLFEPERAFIPGQHWRLNEAAD